MDVSQRTYTPENIVFNGNLFKKGNILVRVLFGTENNCSLVRMLSFLRVSCIRMSLNLGATFSCFGLNTGFLATGHFKNLIAEIVNNAIKQKNTQ